MPSGTCTATRHGDPTLSVLHNANRYAIDRCRCRPAIEAKRLYEKRRRCGYLQPALIDPTGTSRRLRALQVNGHSFAAIRAASPPDPITGRGPSLFTLREIARGARRRLIQQRVADGVAVAYDRLWNVAGDSPIAAARARAKGWLPPLAYDDDSIDDPDQRVAYSSVSLVGGSDYKRRERSARSARNTDEPDPVAVERALTGDRVRLTRAERAEVVQRIVERGQGVARVCQLLPVSNATAQRLVNDARRETRVSSAKVAS